MTALDLGDVQGLILRGYHMARVRHLVLRIDRPAAARAVLGKLADGSRGVPQVTSAEEWTGGKPAFALNVGLTYAGLEALDLPPFSFRSFPSFVAGAVEQAPAIGDTGESGPQHWAGQMGTAPVHALLSLYARDGDALEETAARLRSLVAGAFVEIHAFDGAALPGDRVHFGYRDGIAQPTIEGGPAKKIPDRQAPVPAWSFVLSDAFEAPYNLPEPRALGWNGSFAAFRVLAQDVAGFEAFLDRHEAEIDRELLAAKICGRWRNGNPLTLTPDRPGEPLPPESINDFDFVGSETRPAAFDDRRGTRCPFGAHIRRTNPRGLEVHGNTALHRIVRRGMPYGPAWQGPGSDPDVERGLLGLFIGASIRNQFEFVMRSWINAGGFAAGLEDRWDPLVGASPEGGGRLTIPRAGQDALVAGGLSRFVRTRGSAYCFLPSLSALRYVASV